MYRFIRVGKSVECLVPSIGISVDSVALAIELNCKLTQEDFAPDVVISLVDLWHVWYLISCALEGDLPAAISIIINTLSKQELDELVRKCQTTRIRKRLKVIVLILDGKLSQWRVGRKLAVGMQTLCDGGNCYSAEGLSGLYDRPCAPDDLRN